MQNFKRDFGGRWRTRRGLGVTLLCLTLLLASCHPCKPCLQPPLLGQFLDPTPLPARESNTNGGLLMWAIASQEAVTRCNDDKAAQKKLINKE